MDLNDKELSKMSDKKLDRVEEAMRHIHARKKSGKEKDNTFANVELDSI